jgi:hypothetical protein
MHRLPVVLGSFRGRSCAFALATAGLALLCPRSAEASVFMGRLAAGAGYMNTNSQNGYGDSTGAALALQIDAGLRLREPLAVHATVIYDRSEWLYFPEGIGKPFAGSMLGFGLGATATFSFVSVGLVAGGQFTSFPSNDDPSSGPNGASLGPFLSGMAGYVWSVTDDTEMGVHGFVRIRSSRDETNSVVYDPRGYQLGLVLSFGLDGKPLLGG